MKKTSLILSLIGIVLLSSCGNTTHSGDSNSSVSNSSNSDVFSSITSESSTSDIEFTLDENMIQNEEVVICLGDTYYLPVTVNDDYKDAWLDYYIDDKSIVTLDADEIFHGLKEGSTKVRIVADDTYYDDITITVIGEDKMKTDFKTDGGNLYGKSFAIFGDSISDVTVSAYPSYERPDLQRAYFWCEQLRDKYNMTMYDYAVNGGTVGYCQGLMNLGAPFSKVGNYVVNQPQCLEDVAKSDYAFIYFGNNDASYGCRIGEIGEVDDGNYRNKESFKGSYSYLIDKIRSANPDIKIVCLSLSHSTWKINPTNPDVEYAKTRQELCDVVKDIAEAKECKYINIFDLWDDETGKDHCPDGIHPHTSGYDLIVKRILEN